MGVDEDRPAVHGSPARDHTVGVRALQLQTESARPVPAQGLHLVEGPMVQQQVDALARGALALGALRRGRLLARTTVNALAQGVQFGDSPSCVRVLAGRRSARLLPSGRITPDCHLRPPVAISGRCERPQGTSREIGSL